MKINVQDLTTEGWQEDKMVYEGIGRVVIHEPLTDFTVKVAQGTFGISARDGGLEIVRPDGSVIAIQQSDPTFRSALTEEIMLSEMDRVTAERLQDSL